MLFSSSTVFAAALCCLIFTFPYVFNTFFCVLNNSLMTTESWQCHCRSGFWWRKRNQHGNNIICNTKANVCNNCVIKFQGHIQDISRGFPTATLSYKQWRSGGTTPCENSNFFNCLKLLYLLVELYTHKSTE